MREHKGTACNCCALVLVVRKQYCINSAAVSVGASPLLHSWETGAKGSRSCSPSNDIQDSHVGAELHKNLKIDVQLTNNYHKGFIQYRIMYYPEMEGIHQDH